MSWSFKQLVEEHGEERALELLQDQKGFGNFKMRNETRSVDLGPNCPFCGESWSSNKACGNDRARVSFFDQRRARRAA